MDQKLLEQAKQEIISSLSQAIAACRADHNSIYAPCDWDIFKPYLDSSRDRLSEFFASNGLDANCLDDFLKEITSDVVSEIVK